MSLYEKLKVSIEVSKDWFKERKENPVRRYREDLPR